MSFAGWANRCGKRHRAIATYRRNVNPGLIEDLPGGPIALDSNAVIYWMEDHPVYAPLLNPLFAAADAGSRTLVTSTLTLLEVLVVPYRTDNGDLAARYEQILTNGKGL